MLLDSGFSFQGSPKDARILKGCDFMHVHSSASLRSACREHKWLLLVNINQ